MQAFIDNSHPALADLLIYSIRANLFAYHMIPLFR
jgi:hypothetical protein